MPFNNWYDYHLFMMNADGTGSTEITKNYWCSTCDEGSFAPSWSPDGSRIAFACGYWDNTLGDWSYRVNTASLCVVDATGKNFRQLTSPTEIFPPAWLNNSQILYGGSCGSAQLTICLFDVNSTLVTEFSPTQISTSGRTNDEPVVTGDTLFYRTNAGSTHSLRMADLIAGTTPTISTLGTTTTPAHVDVVSDTFNVNNVNYYTVSKNGLRRIAYEDQTNTSCIGGHFTYLYYAPQINNHPSDPPTWTDFGGTTNRFIDDQYCGPDWDGNTTTPTDLWAFRNSADWNP
jgi:hypothetical protein